MSLHAVTTGDPARPPLLLLHGFLGSSADWQPLLGALSAEWFVISADLPGHGQSLQLPAAAYTPDGVVAGLLALLDQLAIERTTCLGYSMGGRMALYAARNAPQRIGRLILESASPGLESSAERADRALWDDRVAHQITTQPLDTFLEKWYALPLFASLRQHPSFPDLFARRQQNDPQELARAMTGLGTGRQPSLWADWPRLPQPVHLISGALDAKYRALAARMVALRPATTSTVVSGAGHTVHCEAPDHFLAALPSPHHAIPTA
jgi:2-succinyl-6-hydroxy-2,4-cyclohexadiene-1-carboxylate synthase